MKRPRTSAPQQTFGELPVVQYRAKILGALRTSDVLILVSATGSGKTTQVPQIVLSADRNARIVITQPRRVAATTVASRVAAECESPVGDLVGYAVRFDDKSSRTRTRIRYVTDGVLLRESLSKGELARYSHVIVDEVHERSVNTDVVLGVLKRCLLASRQRQDSSFGKVVIMSATTDADKMEEYFSRRGKLKVSSLHIPGRLHPVTPMYAAVPVQDFVDGAVTAALQIHVDYPMDGDILVFLPGQDEIMSALSLLSERVRRHLPAAMAKSVEARPLFASLSAAEQLRAITSLPSELRGKVRKVILSTNVAETSVTIPDVKYIVDSGMAKVRSLMSARGVTADVLRLEPISRAQAEQRKGRAGRTSHGYAFRLYTEAQFNALAEYPTPEILRVDAAGSVLQIIAYDTAASGCGLRKFPFLDSPPKKTLALALESLMALGALDDEMKLTETGRLMSRIPTSPMLARSLLEACRLGCTEDMVILAAVLSVEGSVTAVKSGQRDSAKAAHRRFLNARGDHLTLLNMYQGFAGEQGHARRAEFCRDHFLNLRTLTSAESICGQLGAVMKDGAVQAWALANPVASDSDLAESSADDLLRRCVVAGYFRNAARRRAEDGRYVLFGGHGGMPGASSLAEGVDIHPSSVLFAGSSKRGPAFVVFGELVLTSKPYLRTVLAVEQSWLTLHSGRYYQSAAASV
jgi:HrpA-like RNA helicase